MKKHIMILLVLFTAVIASFGQQAEHGKNMMTDFTPPSPEAFKMTKYGDVPIDEFNGKVKIDIPLYNYTAGKLQLPIALNYYGAGVKVNDLPTQVGINWSLQAGGIITREIRDKVDETSNRPNLTDVQVNALNLQDCTTEAGQLIQYLFTSNNDNQADVFRFNFLNYSGSFYLDDDMLPVLVKNDQNLKIVKVGSLASDKIFRITDTNGVMYYFGGPQGCEETYNRTITGSDQQFTPQGTTSFYLYEIKDPNSGRIFFTYDSLSPYFVDLNKSYSFTRSIAEDMGDSDCTGSTPDIEKVSLTKMSIHGNKLLKKIYSENNDEVILFNRTMIDNDVFKSYLNNIEVRKGASFEDLDGILISKSEFEYLGLEDPTTAPRFFLKKVMINKELQEGTEPNKKYEEYRMEYNYPESLPDRFSTKIDMLGYYNGIYNQDLYPCPSNATGAGCPNRTANFIYSSLGALSRIYYPTGGYTDFEYEPQPSFVPGYYGVGLGSETYIHSLVAPQLPISRLHTEIPGIYTSLFEGDQYRELPPNLDGTIPISIYTGTVGGVPNHNATVTLKITDQGTDGTTSSVYTKNGWDSHIVTFNYSFNITHTYKIEFDMTPPTATYPGYYSDASFSFAVPGEHIPTEGAGVRIKRINNVADGENPESKKRFYYKSYDKLNLYSADQFEFTPRQSISGSMKPCTQVLGAMVPQKTQTFYSDCIASDYNCSEVKYKEYSTVTVSYGGDNFEQGGTEKTFKVSEDSEYFNVAPLTPRLVEAYQSDYPNSKHNTVSLDGLLLKEKTLENRNGTVYKVREKKYQYEYPLITKKANFFGYELFGFSSLPNIYDVLANMTTSYTNHGGWFDCLNPDPYNRCNCCSSYDGIDTWMLNKMKQKLIAENSPYLSNFDDNISSGLYVINYSFSNNYNSAGIALLKKIGACNNANTLSNRFIGGYYTSSFDFRKTLEKEVSYIDPVPATLVPLEYEGEVPPGNPTQEQLEMPYKKITTTQAYEYGTLKGLPKSIITSTSENNITRIQKNYYADEAASLGGLTLVQIAACDKLKDQNRIATPIQVEEYQNAALLNKQRTIYKAWNNSPSAVFPESIQTAKGGAPLEDRVIFTSYDNKGNPEIVSLKDGTLARYIYNTNNQVHIKIENYIDTDVNRPMAVPGPDPDDCAVIASYLKSMVTIYNYDSNTHQISNIVSPNCQKTYYEYDSMHRLRYIKDNDLNILQEFDRNYKP